MFTLKNSDAFSIFSRSRGAPGGFALAFALFVMLIISVIGLALASILIGGQKEAFNYVGNTRALYCARAGISRAIAELEANGGWTQCSPLGLSQPCENIGTGSYAVLVNPDPNNATRTTRQWRVTSVGTSGGSTRTLTAYLEDTSFAQYAYFTDKERSSSGSVIWFITADKLTGNVHTNGYFSMMGTPNFYSRVTSSQGVVDGPIDPYYNTAAGIYTQGSTSTGDVTKFYHYNTSYANDYPTALTNSPLFSFSGAQPNVPFPIDLSSISSRASQTFTGNCAMSLQVSGGSGIVVVSGCSPAGTYTIFSGASAPPNGNVFFVNGDVTISGTLKGSLTVAGSADIHINNNILYNDKSTDVLGLAATNNIYLDADPDIPANFEIDAALMALNTSFAVTNYNTGVPRGVLTVYGGIVQDTRGAVGTTNNGAVVTGYSKNYVYDDVLRNTPPPAFPTTGRIVLKQLSDSSAFQ